MSKNNKKIKHHKIPQYVFGLENAIGLAGSATPLLGQGFSDSGGGGALTGALGGASMGMALGPIGAAAGGVIGGITGLFAGKKRRRQKRLLEQKKKEATQRQVDVTGFQNQLAQSNEMAMDFELENPMIPTFKFGIESTGNKAYVNNQEVIQYPNGKTKNIIDNSGIEDNVLVNLPNNSSVFSDDLKTKDGITFAEKAKKLSIIKDKKYKNNDLFSIQSQELNNAYVERELEKLKLEQAMARSGKKTKNGMPAYADGLEGTRYQRTKAAGKSMYGRLTSGARANYPDHIPSGDWSQFDPFAINFGATNIPKQGVQSMNSQINPMIQPKSTVIKPYGMDDAEFVKDWFVNDGGSSQSTSQSNKLQDPVYKQLPVTKAAKRNQGTIPATFIAPDRPVANITPTFDTTLNTRGPVSINNVIPGNNSEIVSDNITKSNGVRLNNQSTDTENRAASSPISGNLLNSGMELLTDYLSLAPYRYNVSEGNKGFDIVNPQHNPYEATINNKMRARRISMTPIMERIQKNRGISRYNANQMTGSGQNMAYNLASQALSDRSYIDALQQGQQINNQYVAEYANVIGNLGSQQMQANQYAEDMTARNKAASDAYRGAAATQLGQFAQNKMTMLNKNRTNRGLLDAITPLMKEGYAAGDWSKIFNQFK